MMHRGGYRTWRRGVWIGAGVVVASLQCAAAPVLVVPQPVFNIGEVEARGQVRHVFELRNDGDRPLRFLRIRPSCNCVTVRMPPGPVAPGESVELEVVMVLKGLKGLQRKAIRLETNDPKRRRMFLWIKGVMKRTVAFDPDPVNLGTVAVGVRQEQRVMLTYPETGVGIARITGADTQIAVEGIDPSRRAFTVSVEPSDTPAGGMISGVLEVSVTGSVARTVSVPVSAFAQPEINVVGGRLDLSRDPTRDSSVVLVLPGRTRDFKVTDVEPPPGAQASIRRMGRGGYQVRLSGLKAPEGVSNLVVHVSTDVEGYERVPVSIAVHRGVEKEQVPNFER